MFNVLLTVKSLEWDESKHRRAGKGTRQGGQFISINEPADNLDADPYRLFLLTDEQIAKNYKQAKESPLYNPAVEEFRSAIADLMPDEVEAEYDDLRANGEKDRKLRAAKNKAPTALDELGEELRKSDVLSGFTMMMLKEQLTDMLDGKEITREAFVDYAAKGFDKEIGKSERWRTVEPEQQKAAAQLALKKIGKLYDVTRLYKDYIKEFANRTSSLRQAHQAAIVKATELINEKILSKAAHENFVDATNQTDDLGLNVDEICRRGQELSQQLVTPPVTMSMIKDNNSSYTFSSRHIMLGTVSSPDLSAVFAHEYGHHLEYTHPDIRKEALAFIRRRIGDKEPERTKNGTIHRDAFLIPYTGYANYGSSSTEAISVGMEMLVRDPVSLAKHDPEHFYLMAHILWGM